MRQYKAWCDGSITKNPGGNGGWGALIDDGEKRRTLSGGEHNSTSNRAEMNAAIMVLTSLPPASEVDLYSDSNYLVLGVMERMRRWEKRGWKGTYGREVKNVDLWQRLHALCQTRTVRMHWIKGHAGIPENELVDRLAKEAARSLK